MRDAVARGQHHTRPMPGGKNPAARLTASQVRAIRRAYPNYTQAALAEKHGVTRSTIGYIVRGKTWRHIQ